VAVPHCLQPAAAGNQGRADERESRSRAATLRFRCTALPHMRPQSSITKRRAGARLSCPPAGRARRC